MSSFVPRVLVVIFALAAIALAAYIWLPHRLSLPLPGVSDAAPNATNAVSPAEEQKLEADRLALERRIATLEAEGALKWGGANFAAAKTRAAESVGARDGGSYALSEQRLTQASQLLDTLERATPAAKGSSAPPTAPKVNPARSGESYEAAAGEGFAALGAGRLAEARAAFERARALRPDGAEAADGLRRVAEAAAHSGGAGVTAGAGGPAGSSAAGSAGVAAAPGIPAGEGTAREAGSAADSSTLAGTGAGTEAPTAAAAAVTPAPGGAAPGSSHLSAARRHALDLEAQERWEDAVRAYGALLRQEHSTFAQVGKDRAEARLELDDALQAMIDRPDRLANSQQVREQARTLLKEARTEPSPGPVLSAQIERLSRLLPDSGKPVHVALVSDSVTLVEIPSVGSFGSFSRRDIELRPGRYTVIGTRQGYRDVRREIVVSPEHENVTVNVSCSEPI
jgi:eukaryotic-like serine/threonine-protein kinase